MPTVLILVVFAVVVLVLVLLTVVVVAIRQEPRDAEMSNVAPSLIAVVVRRLLGVYLRRPTTLADSADWREERSPEMRPTTARSRPSGGRR
jgi:heme/copper-type cytochrome/quinol oxidase subunit 2